MSKQDRDSEKWADVIEALPNTQFRVHLDGDAPEKLRLAYLAGRLKMNFIKVLIGDRVKVFCPDLNGICRLTFRPKAGKES